MQLDPPLNVSLDESYMEGLSPTDIALVETEQTARSVRDGSTAYQHVLCTSNDQGQLSLLAKRKNIQDSLQIYLQAFLISKTAACYNALVSHNSLISKGIEAKGFSWQAYPPIFKIHGKLIAAIQSNLSDITTNGRYLAIQYLNTSKYAISQSNNDVMDTHVANLLKTVNQPLGKRPSYRNIGSWGHVRQDRITPPCNSMPTLTDQNIMRAHNAIHIRFDVFKPFPVDCFVVLIDRLSEEQEVGRLGMGSAPRLVRSQG